MKTLLLPYSLAYWSPSTTSSPPLRSKTRTLPLTMFKVSSYNMRHDKEGASVTMARHSSPRKEICENIYQRKPSNIPTMENLATSHQNAGNTSQKKKAKLTLQNQIIMVMMATTCLFWQKQHIQTITPGI